MKKFGAVFVLFSSLVIFTRDGSCALKDRLVDPHYLRPPSAVACRLSYGGVNSSTVSKALHDLRGGSLEFEYEKTGSSNPFSGVIGLGYLNLDNSSASVTAYLKGPFLKAGVNLIAFSSPSMDFKLGPDIRFIQMEVADKDNSEKSYTGIGMGINLAVNISIKPKWFAGAGIREGILNFGNEELKTRYLFLTLQRLL
ncbi:MAG: hypothetical protein AB1611_09980 [bacterium]